MNLNKINLFYIGIYGVKIFSINIFSDWVFNGHNVHYTCGETVKCYDAALVLLHHASLNKNEHVPKAEQCMNAPFFTKSACNCVLKVH